MGLLVFMACIAIFDVMWLNSVNTSKHERQLFQKNSQLVKIFVLQLWLEQQQHTQGSPRTEGTIGVD